MHQYFILVLVSILTVLNFKMKMVIICIALFLLVTRPVGHKMLKYFMSDHECQVTKGMRWGMLIVKRGVRGPSPRKFYNVCDLNVLLDHWFYIHKE